MRNSLDVVPSLRKTRGEVPVVNTSPAQAMDVAVVTIDDVAWVAAAQVQRGEVRQAAERTLALGFTV
jgi:hypothetical protein